MMYIDLYVVLLSNVEEKKIEHMSLSPVQDQINLSVFVLLFVL